MLIDRDDYPTINEPATPEYVLGVLRDGYRLYSAWNGDGDKSLDVTLDTSLATCYALFDGVAALEETLELALLEDFPTAAHFALYQVEEMDGYRRLRRPEPTTLRTWCEMIARVIHRPKIVAAEFTGKPCRIAGGFLAVRKHLEQTGVVLPDEIGPSTPLAPYLRRYGQEIGVYVSHLAPGALPKLEVVPLSNPWPDRGMSLGCGGGLLAVVGVCVGWQTSHFSLTFGCIALLAGCVLIARLAMHRMIPDRVSFGDLVTFRDLAELITRNNDDFDYQATA